uniref:Uncharacterized protein n=1 Tax=Opuntia streptacantha TaxID=393608 RepID=A0A7C9DHT5_OPUST
MEGGKALGRAGELFHEARPPLPANHRGTDNPTPRVPSARASDPIPVPASDPTWAPVVVVEPGYAEPRPEEPIAAAAVVSRPSPATPDRDGEGGEGECDEEK